MLSLMRKHAKYFYGLFLLVILTFIFWGVGSVSKPESSSIAEVGGRKVSLEEYQRDYYRTERQYRDVYGEKYDAQMAEKLDLKNKVLNSLVNEYMLVLLADEMGVVVTDREVEETIINDPIFAVEGSFSKDVYLERLRNNGFTPQSYEALKRRALMVQKVERLIGEAVDVSPEDIEGLQGNEDTAKRIREILLYSKRQQALQSFLDGLKERYGVKVYADRLP